MRRKCDRAVHGPVQGEGLELRAHAGKVPRTERFVADASKRVVVLDARFTEQIHGFEKQRDVRREVEAR
jgi:hypothetical protein